MLDRVRDFLSRRRQAYARVFDRENDPLGDKGVVLDDLARFCRFGESVFDPSQRKTDVLIGRQEVFARILDHSGLDIETLYGKYNSDKFKLRSKTDET